MHPDQEQNPLELIDPELADTLKELQKQNGLSNEDIEAIAEILAGITEECKINLFDHQKKHADIVDRLKDCGLKINREHVNFQQYNKDHNTDLRTILIITKKK